MEMSNGMKTACYDDVTKAMKICNLPNQQFIKNWHFDIQAFLRNVHSPVKEPLLYMCIWTHIS